MLEAVYVEHVALRVLAKDTLDANQDAKMLSLNRNQNISLMQMEV